MNYKLVETFAELSKTLNLTKTAENLYLTQSAVSYRLKALEDDLGVILIERERGFKKIKCNRQVGLNTLSQIRFNS